MTYTQDEDLLPEYEFDYGKAQPNRFAKRTAVAVALQADIGAYLQARAQATGLPLGDLVNSMLSKTLNSSNPSNSRTSAQC